MDRILDINPEIYEKAKLEQAMNQGVEVLLNMLKRRLEVY